MQKTMTKLGAFPGSASKPSDKLEGMKWRNLYFSNKNTMHYGKCLFNSEHDAEQAALNIVKIVRSYDGNKERVGNFTSMMPNLKSCDYAWHMQIPILAHNQ